MIIRTTMAVLLLAACDAGSQASSPPAASASAPVLGAGAPLGDPPPPAAEPDTLPDRSSPDALLRALVAARKDERLSLAFLARAERPTAGKAQLDKLDEARAHRHFRMPSVQAMWAQIEEAVAGGKFRIEERDDRATATLYVGGSLGTSTLSFEKVEGHWYLSLGN